MAQRRVAASASQPAPRTRRSTDVPDVEVPDYCARPACRLQFMRTIGRGRPQAYCSEMCRRSAERELRQTQAKLAHFAAVVEQLRSDIAAFGSQDVDPAAEAAQAAKAATDRAAGILAFLEGSDEPLARELRSLHSAVVPLVTISQAS